jgi:hypothetical protein
MLKTIALSEKLLKVTKSQHAIKIALWREKVWNMSFKGTVSRKSWRDIGMGS